MAETIKSRDINDALDDLRPEPPVWHKVRKEDVITAGMRAGIFVTIAGFQIFDGPQSGRELAVAVFLWLVTLAIAISIIVGMYRKYRRGEETQVEGFRLPSWLRRRDDIAPKKDIRNSK
ncbi:MAG TPA: hypothetical protein VK978_02560 [Candidatus Saccharimonadales bacterium]|nr:hypothetical protein [Candidatus Saccharimonadales bacterium]